MSTSLDEMLKSFTDSVERDQFITQQHKTILELTKKIEKLQAKNKHLEDLLQEKTPALVGEYSPMIKNGAIIEDHEENICRMELKKLHDTSLERQLTLEETRKVEIYTKLLVMINQKPKHEVIETKKKSNEELLRLVESDESE